MFVICSWVLLKKKIILRPFRRSLEAIPKDLLFTKENLSITEFNVFSAALVTCHTHFIFPVNRWNSTQFDLEILGQWLQEKRAPYFAQGYSIMNNRKLNLYRMINDRKKKSNKQASWLLKSKLLVRTLTKWSRKSLVMEPRGWKRDVYFSDVTLLNFVQRFLTS